MTINPLDAYESYLKSTGRQFTDLRIRIATFVLRIKGAFEADDVGMKLADTDDIRRPSVYRTISELRDAGLLQYDSTTGQWSVK